MKYRFKKYFAEFLGTMIFVFLGCGAGITVGMDHKKGTGYLITALVFGIVYVVLYYGLARISDCHLNPAVSLSMLIAKKIDVFDFLGYTVAQLAGAFGACGIMTGVFWGHTGSYGANTYYDAEPIVSVVIELIVTMVLVSVFLQSSKLSEGFLGLYRGLGVLLVYLFSIQLTGGSANPAKSIATAVFAGSEAITESLVYVAGAFAGAIIAALIYKLFEKGKDEGCMSELPQIKETSEEKTGLENPVEEMDE